MKATFVFVPPGGGIQDYSADFDIPAVPQSGDYISVTREGEVGSSDFIVRQTQWFLIQQDSESSILAPGDKPPIGMVRRLYIECEFATGPTSSEQHLESCECYKIKGMEPKKFK